MACSILRVGSVRACVRAQMPGGVAEVEVMIGMAGEG